MNAVYQNDAEATRVFLRSGANVNEQNLAGVSSLHIGAKNNSVKAVKVLIEYKAILDIRDDELWTPLMRACLNKNPKIVELLINNGANIWLTNQFNENALMHAVMSDCIECIYIIKDNYKKNNYNVNKVISEINKSLNIVYKKENKKMEEVLNDLYNDVTSADITEKNKDNNDKKKIVTIFKKDKQIEENRVEKIKENNKNKIKEELNYIIKKIYIFQGQTKKYNSNDLKNN